MSGSEIDQVFSDNFEDAKSFLEIARKCHKRGEERFSAAFAKASLLAAFSSFEAFLHSISSDFIDSNNKQLSVHDRGFLMELEVSLNSEGAFYITKKSKFGRVEDRILFLYRRLSGKRFDTTKKFWSVFRDSSILRNQVAHPKSNTVVSISILENALSAILETMNYISQGIFKKPLPLASYGLTAKIDLSTAFVD